MPTAVTVEPLNFDLYRRESTATHRMCHIERKLIRCICLVHRLVLPPNRPIKSMFSRPGSISPT